MLPLVLYLYLKPLYSKRGGVTIFAEPFKKLLLNETFLKNPL